MNYEIITHPTEEPITLDQLKNHLKLPTAGESFSVSLSIYPGSHEVAASFSLVGSAINVLGNEATFVVVAGECLGTVTIKLQDSINGSGSWEDVDDGDFNAITSANDNQSYQLQYVGSKPYVRAVATVAGAASNFAVEAHLYPLEDDEDAFLNGIITAARTQAEHYQKRQLLLATYKLTMSYLPAVFQFLVHPVASITHVKYYDSNNVLQTLDPSNYVIDRNRKPYLLRRSAAGSFPATYCRPDAVEIEFEAGYESADDVPMPTKQAIMLMCGSMYRYREELSETSVNILPTACRLLDVDCWT